MVAAVNGIPFTLTLPETPVPRHMNEFSCILLYGQIHTSIASGHGTNLCPDAE